MPYENYAINNANGCMDIGGDPIILECDGKSYLFEWHNYFGPTFCGKRGDHLKNQPGPKCPVWEAITAWEKQGRQVVVGKAVWTPIPKRKHRAKHLGGRQYMAVPDDTPLGDGVVEFQEK